MNDPVTQTQLKVSQSIKKSLKEKASYNPYSVENLVFKVAEQLEKCGVPIVMSQHSTAQSQISLKTLTEGFMQNAIKVTEKIPDDDPSCPFDFDDLENPEQFDSFSTFYKMKIAKQTGLDPSRIYINSVTKGSIKVEWTTDDSDKLNESFETQPELEKKLKIHNFFQYFHLCPQDFDPRGNIQFNESKNYVQTRGGWPYYQPVKCKRYGINVSKKYDNGDDTWLMMNGKPGEWAVAFHGVRAPKAFQPSQPKTLNLIMQGRQTNSMLKAFGGQAYKDSNAINKPNQRVGVGIYCTPHMQIAFNGFIDTSDEYALIFQCRVNPKQVKVCNYEPYWVINDTKNIRPYGIILIKNTIVKQYPSITQQFGKIFSYKDYKAQIEKYINSY